MTIPFRLPHPLLGCLFCLVLLSAHRHAGCRRASTSSTAEPVTEARSVDFLLKKMAQYDADAASIKSLTARVKLNTISEGGSLSATANVVWIRDSALCIAIKKFGYEALRALVTRDSVFVLYRLDKTYTAESIGSLQAQFNLPIEANSDLIARVVLGQMLESEQLTLRSDVDQAMYRLSGEQPRYAAAYHIEGGTFLLKKQFFEQKKDQLGIELQHTDFRLLDGGTRLRFPHQRVVEVREQGQTNGRVEMDFSDISINTNPTFRFEIPNHYTKK
jgi:hypothetical protein